MMNRLQTLSTVFQRPPVTVLEPVTDVLHGTEIVDPYRWLEDQSSPRTRQWIADQEQYCRNYFESLPDRSAIRSRVSQLLSNEFISAPWEVAGRIFFERRLAEEHQPVIVARDTAGHETVLMDPAKFYADISASAAIAAISGEGRFMAVAIRFGGTEEAEIRILDLANQVVLEDHLPKGYCNGFAFASSVPGFYYSHRTLASGSTAATVYFHRLGDASSRDVEVFKTYGPQVGIHILSHPPARLLLYAVTSSTKRRTTRIYLQRENDDAAQLLVPEIEARIAPFFLADRLFAFTDFEAPNGRLVAIDRTDGNPRLWHNIVPPTGQRIRQFSVAGGRIFITRAHRFSMSISVHHPDGSTDGDVPLLPYSTVDLLNPLHTSSKLFFSCTSINQPPSLFSFDPATKMTAPLQISRPLVDREPASIEELDYTSKDGTMVPVLLASRKDLSLRSRSRTTFLTGYGGFGSAVTPRFSAFATYLLEQGLLFAVPAIRGGGELGAEWHNAGKLGKRQNAFDDFLSCAEWLIESGRTSPGKVAIGGGSNAGLLVGAVITQRPALFRAAICLGPLLDMLRYHRFDHAAAWAAEYGSPEEAADFSWLYAYSPYHHVSPNRKYPAMLLISGDADGRCNPMHARKMTARLQAATSSGHPVLLDYKPLWGHVPSQPLNVKIESLTDRLSFVCHELGVRVL